EEGLAEGVSGAIVRRFPRQLQALTIDDGGMENAAIGHRRQIAATEAGGRSRFATRRHISDTPLADLVAVNAVSTRYIGITWTSLIDHCRRSGIGSVINLPIGTEVPVSLAHPAEIGPCSIERESRDLRR